MDTFLEIDSRNTDDAAAKAIGFAKRMSELEMFFSLQTAIRVFESKRDLQ